MNHVVIFGGESDLAPAIQAMFAKKEVVCHLLSKEEADVRDIASLDRAISYYKPDCVINLAGVSHLQPLLNSNREQWIEEIETNLIGSYNVAHAAAHKKLMMLFIGSVAGFHGKPNHSGYCASKAGVHALVQSLAAEGYQAYAIAPGRVNTKMREKDFPGEDPQTRLTPEQIAEVVEKIVAGDYQPGDVIVIRKKGFETFEWVYQGEPWRKDLQIQPWEAPSGY